MWPREINKTFCDANGIPLKTMTRDTHLAGTERVLFKVGMSRKLGFGQFPAAHRESDVFRPSGGMEAYLAPTYARVEGYPQQNTHTQPHMDAWWPC